MDTFKIIFLVAASTIALYSCSSNPNTLQDGEAVKVKVISPDKGNNEGFSFSGQVTSKQTAGISTRMMGYVNKIYVKPGDKVNRGQLLISISNDDIMAKRSQAQAMITEAEAAAENAQRDYERFKKLREQNSVSDKELENVELQNTSVKAKLQMAKQGLNEIDAMLSYTQIRAPFSGVVTQKMIDEGSMANPGMPLLVVEQGGELQIEASVAENYISHIKTGDKATIELKSISAIVEGIVTELSPSSYGTGGQYSMKLSFDHTKAKEIHSGMYATIFIASDKAHNISSKLMVDTSAIVYRDQLTGVYVVNNQDLASLRWVRLGKTSGDQVEVLSGLNANDIIISEAEGRLYNGRKVVISEKQ